MQRICWRNRKDMWWEWIRWGDSDFLVRDEDLWWESIQIGRGNKSLVGVDPDGEVTAEPFMQRTCWRKRKDMRWEWIRLVRTGLSGWR